MVYLAHRRVQVVLLAAVAALFILPQLTPAHAESYTLVIVPSRAQETNNPGVTLSLRVTGANTGLSYAFEWVVRDPPGNNKNAAKSSVAGQSSFELNVTYPQDFGGGASIQFVGTHDVSIIQTSPPSINPLVAIGSFDIGLTDKLAYQRTSPVSIRATSYNANEDVTLEITRGGSPVESRIVTSDPSGNLAHVWQTGPSTLTGNHTVTLTGSTTPAKNPPDRQTFAVQNAQLAIAITVPNATLASGDQLAISAMATYPDGAVLSQGSVVAALSVGSQPIGSQFSLSWDPDRARWTGNYTANGTEPSGIWTVAVSASDAFGNSGQSTKLAAENVSPPSQPPTGQNPLTSFWFLTVVAVIGVGAFLGGLFFRRKKVVRHQLMVDLQAVRREADQVRDQKFFKSVQDQLHRNKNDSGEKG